MAREITYINFEISLKVFMPNITTNRALHMQITSLQSLFVVKCLGR